MADPPSNRTRRCVDPRRDLPSVNISRSKAFRPASSARNGLRDSLFLSVILGLSVVLYAGRLGFYADDWKFLETLTFSTDQSLPGLFRTFYTESETVWMRPVQAIEQAILYWFFGLRPLGYHLVNSTVLLSGVLLFYWVLRELNCERWLALSLPAVYGLLPHYSTDRVWMATFMATL